MRRESALLIVVLLTVGGPSRASIWPTAERRVERELTDPDVVVRRRAARSLGELPRSAARRLALAALADADADVRIDAVRTAVELGGAELGARLVAWLTDPDVRIRLAAAEALGERPSAAALPALARASSDTDPKVRASVARALGASLSPDAVVPLLGRLDDPAPDVRRDVVNALGHLADKRAVVPLLAKVEDSTGSVRRAAAHALGLLGDARAVSALVLVLRDSDEAVRVAALEAVGRLGDGSAVSSVAAVLTASEPAVRAAAARALATLATPPALAVLVAELGRVDADPEVIVSALGLAGAAALPALRACVDALSAPLRVDGCARALGEAGDESDAPRLGQALAHGSLAPLAALPVLGKIGGQAALPAVLEQLGSSDAAVRRAAIAALGALLDPKHPDGRAVDPLLAAWRARGTAPLERTQLLRLLGRTGAPRVAPELVRVAEEATLPAAVLAAVQGLGDLGPGAWETALLAKLDDDAGDVRTAAALALRRIGSFRVLPALLARLEAGAEQDRLAIGLALPGAAATSRDGHLLARMRALLLRTAGPERDALIEAIAAVPSAGAALRELASASDPADRAKLAEALAAAATDGTSTLIALARDAAPTVRANAAWSLGAAASANAALATGELARLLGDRDARVAANAAVALGRVAARSKHDIRATLCERAADTRASIRAAALDGLRLASQSCDSALVLRLLAADPAPRVRAAAAALLSSRAQAKPESLALARCVAEDENIDVAARCAARAASLPSDLEAVLVFVVPPGGDVPAAGAPFALRFSDGTQRFGAADRRGAVYEPRAPAGALELGVLPAAGD